MPDLPALAIVGFNTTLHRYSAFERRGARVIILTYKKRERSRFPDIRLHSLSLCLSFTTQEAKLEFLSLIYHPDHSSG